MKKSKHNQEFNIPEGYFESFEIRLQQKIQQENTVLPNTQESGFTIPEDYFDTFESQLNQKIQSQKHSSKVIDLFSVRRLIYISSIAAAITLLIVFLPTTSSETSYTTFDTSTIDIMDIENYINDGTLEVSDNDIAQLFDDIEFSIAEHSIEKLNDDTVIEYFSEEEIQLDYLDPENF
ncbi:hypothetical protein [Aquimarina rhabdastrellae]